MQELKGLYSAEALDPLLQEGQISRLDYLFHHEDKKPEFETFCNHHSLQPDENAADAFFEHLLETEKQDHLDDE